MQRHPDGVVMVTFSAPEEADSCVVAVNGRWFAGCQLEATIWDGRTKYQVKETQEEMEKRLSSWHSFLESESHAKENKTSTDTLSDTTPETSADNHEAPDAEVETVTAENNDETVVSNTDDHRKSTVAVSNDISGITDTVVDGPQWLNSLIAAVLRYLAVAGLFHVFDLWRHSSSHAMVVKTVPLAGRHWQEAVELKPFRGQRHFSVWCFWTASAVCFRELQAGDDCQWDAVVCSTEIRLEGHNVTSYTEGITECLDLVVKCCLLADW